MDFSFIVSVPADRARTNPWVETHRITFGIIVSGSIVIPKGHKGKTGLQLFRGLHKILPAGADSYFKGNDVVIPLAPKAKIDDRPYELTSESWNEDTVNSHEFYIYLTMKTPGNPGDFMHERKHTRRRLTEGEISGIVEGKRR